MHWHLTLHWILHLHRLLHRFWLHRITQYWLRDIIIRHVCIWRLSLTVWHNVRRTSASATTILFMGIGWIGFPLWSYIRGIPCIRFNELWTSLLSFCFNCRHLKLHKQRFSVRHTDHFFFRLSFRGRDFWLSFNGCNRHRSRKLGRNHFRHVQHFLVDARL